MAQRQKLDLKKLLPLANRNEMLDSMISNLFNRFVSEEQTILINGRIGQSVVGEPDITADSLDREINALIPALYTKSGSKESVYTFFDLLNRLDALDTDTDHLRDWMAEQSYNYTLPISIDKFINYSQYYWYGADLVNVSSAPPVLSWNTKVEPEYYVIQAPQQTDTTKLDVRLATTRDINLWANDRPPETFTVRFLSSNTFKVTTDGGSEIYVNGSNVDTFTLTDTTPGVVTTVTISTDDSFSAPALSNPAQGRYDLMSFFLTSGNFNFAAGDYFTIQITYFTSSILISFDTANAVGKGAISGVQTLSGHMFIDGVRVINGDRILVKDQLDPAKNGIYLVYPGIQWARSPDASATTSFPIGSEVYVLEGSQAGLTFVSAGTLGTDLTFPTSSLKASTINDWQKYNFWIHRDDFAQVESLGVTLDKAIKATRPIIEYKSSLELNNNVDNGIPSAPPIGGTPNSVQAKTRFNQIPQFNLYRYDGTHQGSTSGIYFYVEDSQYPVDSILQKRVKTTANTDYVFGIGLQDEAGRLLYYKENTSAGSELKSVWQGGPAVPEATAPIFVGLTANPGSITINSISSNADNQTWTIMAFDSTTWNVFGSRSGKLAIDAHVGELYTHADDLTFTINTGVNTPVTGESFIFTVHAPIAPRYVKKDSTGKYVNYPHWKMGDAEDGVIDGAWMNPARMFENIERQLEPEIIFADYLGHARSVIKNQNGFIGSSIGNNNSRTLPFNSGVGGTIREFSSNFPLLSSMLIQKDISPLTIIDFAEDAYHVALSSVQQFMLNDFPTYLSSVAATTTTGLNPGADDVQQLLAYFEGLRASNENLKSVFSDSTALVSNWPATLPMLGLVEKVEPHATYDLELGINVIVHHDGHVSPYNVRDLEFDQNLIRTKVTRSDGAITTGIFAQSQPVQPYARQLWYKTDTTEMFLFDVLHDTTTVPPAGNVGDLWFNRQLSMMKEWSNVQHAWVNSTVTASSRWVPFSTEAVKNNLILAIEQKLYNSVPASQQINIDISEATNTEDKFKEFNIIELARYAAAYKFDTYASDYRANDPLTWNYSSAFSKARWFDVLKNNFDIPGVSLPTCRPDLEPWKLMGYDVMPTTWMSDYGSPVIPTTNVVNARVIAPANIVLFSGLPTIDGVQLATNDVILLTKQSIQSDNGLYVVSPSITWARVSTVLDTGLTVNVTEGATRAKTSWVLTDANPLVLGFEQARQWKESMWTDIAAHLPVGTKLSVNTFTDELLAPYVSPVVSPLITVNALTTSIPTSKADAYSFGQNGPIETVWKKSVEYKYGLARSMFRLKPLPFLDKTWGETYIQTGNNVRVERNLMASLPSSKFLMHGEKLNIINQYTPEDCMMRIENIMSWTQAGVVTYKVTHTADNVAIFGIYFNGKYYGDVPANSSVYHGFVGAESIIDGISLPGIKIRDRGIPFELGDTFTLTLDADQSTQTWQHTPARVKIFKGLGQWFTHLLRHNFIDAEFSDATIAYRGWDVKLAHRLGALIRPDSLTISTPMGDLPPTAYNVLLKKTSDTASLWISGLRVQLLEMRSKTINNATGLYVPASDAADWIFRVESYNPEHPILECYEMKSIADGGNFETFNILDKSTTKLAWYRLTDKTSIVSKTTPVTIRGLQNVIDFVFGYITRLEDLGWTTQSDTPTTDATTGRNIDWQLEIEKLVNNIYLGMSAGDAFILNPFASKLIINTPTGLLSRYTESNFVDANSMQAVFDVTGKNIPLSDVNVIRTDEKTVTYSNTPIFSAHVFLDEYEHLILMNKKFSDEIASNTVFNTFLGIRINTAFLNFIRQQVINRKPTIDGFFLSGNDVKRNMSSSVDAISNYYDADKTFYEKSTATHALALLGFTKKDYFSNINVTDTTQFNFWRGLIQVKGTNMAIDAFVNYKKFDRASTDEYWAYKLAEFGDSRERSFPEIKLTISDVTQKFTQVQFYSAADPNYNQLDLYTQIENMDDARWFSIDDLGTGMHFEATPITETLEAPGAGYYKLQNIYHNGDDMEPTITSHSGESTCYFVNASLVYVSGNDTYYINGYTWMNPTKHSPLKLFNYATNTLIEEIGLWHPAIGIHAALPLEVVDMISSTDPTNYNYSTQTTNNPNYRSLKPWGMREVGRVWWDTSNLAYIPYYDATIFPSRAARHARWGSLAEWASVDLYEWTESPVHPSKYNDRAALEEGDSNIDSSVRLSGTVALQKFYSRDRSITTRPIAWSYVPTGVAAIHPSFSNETFTDVWISGNRLIADRGRTEAANLVSGRKFGTFKALTNKPNGEFSIGSTVDFTIGSSLDPLAPVMGAALSLSIITGGIFGTRIGTISLDTYVDGVDYVRMSDSTGFYQDIEITPANELDTQMLFVFDKFGLSLTVAVSPNTSSAAIAALISVSDIVVREMVDFTVTVPFSVDPGNKLSNSIGDGVSNPSDYTWITWSIPTQAQLDADLLSPFNSWKPYPGETIVVSPSADIVKAMNSSDNKLTLKSGIPIVRYASTWGNWKALEAIKTEQISDGSISVGFALPDTIVATRLSIYANGVQINPGAYVITENAVNLVNTLAEGTSVRLFYRAYQPSAAELAFDPEVKEDFSIQTQYKQDYQYTKLDVRDTAGNMIGSKYYFWVQNKTVPQTNKSMSLAQAAKILKSGATIYALFSRMNPLYVLKSNDTTESVINSSFIEGAIIDEQASLTASGKSAIISNSAAFDSFAIAGLSSVVSRNDAYKLRMLRDFTLRDDPQEMDLKNVHVEWALIRKTQSSKIPLQLWNKLTDAIAGTDAVGNQLPSQARIDYDLKNGTRSRFGFKAGQIYADTALLRTSVVHTILNTSLTIRLGHTTIPDTITALNLNQSDTWFADAATARTTMNLIWNTARASQVNEIFFNSLDDALANNYEFSDLFKTSLITVNSSVVVTEATQTELIDEQY